MPARSPGAGCDSSPRGHLATYGDSFGCDNLGGGATGIWWVEARDATQHPTMHRTVSTTKHDPAPDVTNAKAEKARFQ